MPHPLNRQVRLAARPLGLPKQSDWRFTTEPVASCGPRQMLVKTLMLSLDPAMRGWMNEGKSYIAPVELGAVMRAAGVGIVLESGDARFQPGMAVSGVWGVQQYGLVDLDEASGGELRVVDLTQAPAEKWLNALGMPGMTAYFGLREIGAPKAGETVVVSGAAGAVGQTVGQVAKILGCRVVGIAGGAAKCGYVVETLGFDACIDYKAGGLRQALKAACPSGVDIYFDNVGGEILDDVLTRINLHARIIICGAISQYNNTTPVRGPANYLSLLVHRARMEGMVVFDYAPRYGEAITQISAWMAAGRLKSKEDIVEGLEQFPDALLKLFSGDNFGKLVLRLAAVEAT